MSHTDAATGETASRRPHWLLTFIRDLVIIVVVAFVISFLLKTFLVRSFYIPSGSMEQTLQVHDKILVNQLQPVPFGIDRGDIVVFKDPGGWLNLDTEVPDPGFFDQVLQAIGLAADTSTEYVVKRVIGIGGDHVVCCDVEGRVTVNGAALDEPYIVIPEGETRASAIDFDVVVPADSVWVMGDNRYSSKDSRYNQNQPGRGFVPEADIVGRAFLINWPLNRLTWLGNYPEVFAEARAAASAAGDSAEPATPVPTE